MKTITVLNGDIFNSSMQTIVNPVNTAGAMGKGLALQFKQRYPSMFEKYKQHCKNGNFTMGKLWLFKPKEEDRWVLNFPTKNHWSEKSKYEYINKGLIKLRDNYKRIGITSIAFPKIGCGLGGLDWSNVKMSILSILHETDLLVEFYE